MSSTTTSAAAAAGPGPALPPPARARLTRELSRLSGDPPPGVAAYAPTPSDPSHLRAQITGPPSTPYAGGIFLVTIRFTARYPFEPPRVRFVTPVYHPNVDSAGRICLDTLKQPPAGSWSPAVSLPSLLTTLRALLGDPNPDDALVPEIAEKYKQNPRKFEEEARKVTSREATEAKCLEMEQELDGKGVTKDGEGGTKKDGEVTTPPHGDAVRAIAGARAGEKKENEQPVEAGVPNPAEVADDDDIKKAASAAASSSTVNAVAPVTGKRAEGPSTSSEGETERNDNKREVEEKGGGKKQKVDAMGQ